ncbi:mitochondrial ribosomal subunit S27-domain-containing protein [Cytidiella melzeri]|nr:mitochondrial ribosomal subunit S27-domain-containing protein [Cytidiella melzeri]
MASITPSRIAALTRLRCSIFQTSYNPTSIRTGAKYLRSRLVGPSMVNYYPETLTVAQLRASTDYKWDLLDKAEVQRLEDIEFKKARGKGTPKKAKSKADSRRTSRRR